jgi:DNA polymerase-3 subunit delta'
MKKKQQKDDDEDRPTPRKAERLVGHEAAEARLLEAYSSGRLPHGWLLTGPRGIGKATLAFRFARFLLRGEGGAAMGLFGDAPEGLYVAPEETVFHQVAAGSHPDLVTLERQRDDKGKLRQVITVDDVRKAIAFTRHTAISGGWRVVVVDAADDLNTSSANALLKILEEPPEQTVMLLVSHAPGRLLPTIRSRCCSLALDGLSEGQVADLLLSLDLDVPADDLIPLARLAEGSPGKAMALAEGGGLALYRDLVALLADYPRIDTERLYAFADRLGRGKDDGPFRLGMELLAWWAGRLARASSIRSLPPPVVPEESAPMERLAAARPPGDWVRFWEEVSELSRRSLAVNLDRKHTVISAFLTLETAES